MAAIWNRRSLGLAVLMIFSIQFSLKGALPWGRIEPSHPLSPYISSQQEAPVYQETSYPPPTTQVTDTTSPGYPEPSTATSGPSPTQTNTPLPGSTTPAIVQFTATNAPTATEGTPQNTPTGVNDIFLTENAEMGQSQATPLPTETSTPSSTPTITATPIPATDASIDQGFKMDWGAFLIGFFGMVVIGSAGWLAFLKRSTLQKTWASLRKRG